MVITKRTKRVKKKIEKDLNYEVKTVKIEKFYIDKDNIDLKKFFSIFSRSTDESPVMAIIVERKYANGIEFEEEIIWGGDFDFYSYLFSLISKELPLMEEVQYEKFYKRVHTMHIHYHPEKDYYVISEYTQEGNLEEVQYKFLPWPFWKDHVIRGSFLVTQLENYDVEYDLIEKIKLKEFLCAGATTITSDYRHEERKYKSLPDGENENEKYEIVFEKGETVVRDYDTVKINGKEYERVK